MKLEQILTFLHTNVFESYKVSEIPHPFSPLTQELRLQIEPAEEGGEVTYDVNGFIQDAVELRITPFVLDTFAHEYDELVRARDALANEMASLQNSNRNLTAQV